MVLIRVLEEDVLGGQQQLFLRSTDFRTRGKGKEAIDRVAARLHDRCRTTYAVRMAGLVRARR